MKELFMTIVYFIIAIFIGLVYINACTSNIARPPIKEIIYVPTPDTMSIQEIVVLREQLRRTQDSLNILKTDTNISTELFVAKYKLERIRHYNDVAKKGNNLKYLRGWINRVLEE